MPIKIEKKKAGPESLPEYENEGPLPSVSHNPPKVLPWWLVFSREIPPSAKNARGERESTVILASAQIPFRGYRLSVDPDIASHFRILDIRVGRNSYSINGHEGAAATLFPPLPNNLTVAERIDYEELLKIKLQCAQISQTLGLSVVNHSDKPHFFSAILWGFGLDE